MTEAPRNDPDWSFAELVRRLADFYAERAERVKLLALGLATLLGSALEILGIGIFLPFVRIINEPEAVLQHERFGPPLRALGITDREGIILFTSAALVALFALKNGYLAVQWRLLYRFIHAKMARVSQEIFEGYLRSPYTFHLKHNSAELIRTLSTEVRHAFNDVMQPVLQLSAEVLVAAGVIGVLFVLNPLAAGGGLVAVGLLSWGIGRINRRRLQTLGDIRAEEQERKYRLLHEGLEGIKEIRVLRREEHFLRGFERSETRFVEALRDALLLKQYPRLSIELMGVLVLSGMIALLLLSGQELAEALPTLVVFGVAVVRLVPAAGKFTSGVNRIRFYLPSLAIVHREWTRSREGARETLELDTGPAIVFRQAVEFDDVSYLYPDSDVPAIRDVSLTIRRGQAVGFVGTSGAGKTTLLHLLLGLLQPTSGRILVDGADLRRNVASWQRQIGYIPQELYMLDDSIRRNVAFGIPDEEIDDEAVWRALEAAQLASSLRSLDAGLDALTGERGARLSGGQGQRLAIARALYGDPEILILDEATSSLDYETEARIAETLQGFAGRKTLIIVSHRHRTVRHCDVIHVLEGGELVASGRFDEVVSTVGV